MAATTATQPHRVKMSFTGPSIPLGRLSLQDAAPAAEPAASDVVAVLASLHYSVRTENGAIVATWSGSDAADVPGRQTWPISHFSAEKVGDSWVIRQRSPDPGPQRGPTPSGSKPTSQTFTDKAAIREKVRAGNDRLRDVLVAHNASARARWAARP